MNLAAVSFRGKIYAIGGLDPAHPTKTVFVYDPASRRWSPGTPLPVALHAHSASVYRGEIWVFGGRDRTVARQRGVWIYNVDDDRWRRGPSLPEPMDTLSTSVSDDRIHAIVDDHYFIYDGERWERGPTLTRPRHALAVYTIGDTLYDGRRLPPPAAAGLNRRREDPRGPDRRRTALPVRRPPGERRGFELGAREAPGSNGREKPGAVVKRVGAGTTSRISWVISAWRARFICSVRLSISSAAFFEALRIAVIRAPCSDAADSSNARKSSVST